MSGDVLVGAAIGFIGSVVGQVIVYISTRIRSSEERHQRSRALQEQRAKDAITDFVVISQQVERLVETRGKKGRLPKNARMIESEMWAKERMVNIVCLADAEVPGATTRYANRLHEGLYDAPRNKQNLDPKRSWMFTAESRDIFVRAARLYLQELLEDKR